jgi:antitoxin ParD1/3/4
MPSKSAITVSLTPELQKFISSRIESGRYRSASEVVREALRCLERSQVPRHAERKASTINDDGGQQ